MILLLILAFLAPAALDMDADLYLLSQVIVRNSDGALVTYMEPSQFSHKDNTALNKFLDAQVSLGSTQITHIDGQNYQTFHSSITYVFDHTDVVASTSLYNNIDNSQILLARFVHDGYPVEPGDVVETRWTFLRPV